LLNSLFKIQNDLTKAPRQSMFLLYKQQRVHLCSIGVLCLKLINVYLGEFYLFNILKRKNNYYLNLSTHLFLVIINTSSFKLSTNLMHCKFKLFILFIVTDALKLTPISVNSRIHVCNQKIK
jgi:hypothetical protein